MSAKQYPLHLEARQQWHYALVHSANHDNGQHSFVAVAGLYTSVYHLTINARWAQYRQKYENVSVVAE